MTDPAAADGGGNAQEHEGRPAQTGAGRMPTVLALPCWERPRERLASLGPEALSEQELLACVLGRGGGGESVLVSAGRLLGRFGSLRGIAGASVEELSGVRGIGFSKAAQLKAAGEIARRLEPQAQPGRTVIDSWESAAAVVVPKLSGKTREHFLSLLLNNRYQLIRVSTIAIGSLSATLVHPRELFKDAISASAAAVILAHNHPSGDPTPSDEDLALTGRLVSAGELLGIEVVDHVIVGGARAISLRATGRLDANAPRLRRTRRGKR